MLTGDPAQVFAGKLIETVGAALTFIVAEAGADAQPLLVTVKLG
jgi:hypothetical protein